MKLKLLSIIGLSPVILATVPMVASCSSTQSKNKLSSDLMVSPPKIDASKFSKEDVQDFEKFHEFKKHDLEAIPGSDDLFVFKAKSGEKVAEGEYVAKSTKALKIPTYLVDLSQYTDNPTDTVIAESVPYIFSKITKNDTDPKKIETKPLGLYVKAEVLKSAPEEGATIFTMASTQHIVVKSFLDVASNIGLNSFKNFNNGPSQEELGYYLLDINYVDGTHNFLSYKESEDKQGIETAMWFQTIDRTRISELLSYLEDELQEKGLTNTLMKITLELMKPSKELLNNVKALHDKLPANKRFIPFPATLPTDPVEVVKLLDNIKNLVNLKGFQGTLIGMRMTTQNTIPLSEASSKEKLFKFDSSKLKDIPATQKNVSQEELLSTKAIVFVDQDVVAPFSAVDYITNLVVQKDNDGSIGFLGATRKGDAWELNVKTTFNWYGSSMINTYTPAGETEGTEKNAFEMLEIVNDVLKNTQGGFPSKEVCDALLEWLSRSIEV